ncbi:hypothetical protein [Lusitaniella coriacea]|uniref:hypothetical protein n=1 Tax=Lusitaniella coriacea TaxID=1983105 RepID=UPI003CF00376
MISTPKSVPELLRETHSQESPRKPIRLLLCGVPQGVERIVHLLHVLGFAEVGEWSPVLPSPVSGEVIRILTRYCTTE